MKPGERTQHDEAAAAGRDDAIVRGKRAAATALEQATAAMREVDTALAKAGIRGKPDFGRADAAFHEADRLRRAAMERAETEVEHALAQAARALHGVAHPAAVHRSHDAHEARQRKSSAKHDRSA